MLASAPPPASLDIIGRDLPHSTKKAKMMSDNPYKQFFLAFWDAYCHHGMNLEDAQPLQEKALQLGLIESYQYDPDEDNGRLQDEWDLEEGDIAYRLATQKGNPMSEQLKSCPFCGEDRASYVHIDPPDSGFVHCLACDSSYGEILPYEEALKAWNTRAAPDTGLIECVAQEAERAQEVHSGAFNCGNYTYEDYQYVSSAIERLRGLATEAMGRYAPKMDEESYDKAFKTVYDSLYEPLLLWYSRDNADDAKAQTESHILEIMEAAKGYLRGGE